MDYFNSLDNGSDIDSSVSNSDSEDERDILPQNVDAVDKALEAFRVRKLQTIIALMPKKIQRTGPERAPFNLVEDMILLICANPEAKYNFLYIGDGIDRAPGSYTTVRFWGNIIVLLKLQRTANACRSRYLKILRLVHPSEYDIFIDLLRKEEYYCQVKYEYHQSRRFLKIRRIISFSQIVKKEQLRLQKQKRPFRSKKIASTLVPKNKNQINDMKVSFQYLTDEFFEEKLLIKKMAKDEQLKSNQQYKDCLIEWIKANSIKLDGFQIDLYMELCEVKLQLSKFLLVKQTFCD